MKYPKRLTNDAYLFSSPIQVFFDAHYGTIDLHWHEFYEMSFIVSGSGIHQLNGGSYPLAPGSLFLLTPADFHALIPDDDGVFEIFNVIFTDEVLTEEIRHLLFRHKNAIMHAFEGESFDAISRDYQRLWNEANEQGAGCGVVMEMTLKRMLVDVARKSHPENGSPEKRTEKSLQRAIRKSLIYIHHHFREQLTLEDAAKQAQLSATYFSECFRKSTGSTFQHYLQDLRLQFAKSLIQVSDLPITEICLVSGFNTLSHFERVFKHKFQQSPRDFRHRAEK